MMCEIRNLPAMKLLCTEIENSISTSVDLIMWKGPNCYLDFVGIVFAQDIYYRFSPLEILSLPLHL